MVWPLLAFTMAGVLSMATASTFDYNLKLTSIDGDHGFKFVVGSQRCISLQSCYVGAPVSAEWQGLPEASWIVFYNEPDCKTIVETTEKAQGPEGSLGFSSANTFVVSSFIVWESGMDSTRGIIDYCFAERASNISRSLV